MKNSNKILKRVYRLLELYKAGELGGEKMPEDENPNLPKQSPENYLYFTLPMALNYQRNSYALWEGANKTWMDTETRSVFSTKAVTGMSEGELKDKLTKYKVALQQNKQPVIWRTLCSTIERNFGGDIRLLFSESNYSVQKIKKYIEEHKADFPYLGGKKIMNYWLHVIEQRTDAFFSDRANINVAPDTHIIQASEKLGIITPDEKAKSNVQDIVADRWKQLLSGTEYCPIDIHTPMWLWSRGKFKVEL
ncbi:MAG: hypothetical protein Q8930_17130 [Bacillota bacterium]|nr:hypothetical protein [Bacillota bacterium]